MSNRIHVGENAYLDLDVLLRTRLLVQASSGGGKSWLLRRLTEQLFGKVQVIVIDPEGEFATLRERFGYVLAAVKGGDTPVTLRPKSPELLATRLLELRSPAVCDLYELPARNRERHDRHAWVRRFLEALIDAPKSLWHPLVVVVDEAHVFVPEKGHGESEASDAMIALATRGRKRGFAPIFATQRLGKLSKDAAAELQNVMIGPTFIDVDRKRAAETLGIEGRDLRTFYDELRMLKPGRFWALGRAIATERTLVTVGPVTTTHPEAGSAKHSAEPPPPPSKVRELLPKLADLPAEAESKVRTESDLRARIAELERELAKKPAPAPAAVKEKRVEVPVVSEAKLERLAGEISKLKERVDAAHATITEWNTLAKTKVAKFVSETGPRVITGAHPATVTTRLRQAPAPARRTGNGADMGLGKMPCALLTALAQHPDGLTRQQVLIFAGYRASGDISTTFATFNESGWIHSAGGRMTITDAGLAALGDFEPLPMGEALRTRILTDARPMERAILSVLFDVYPNAISRGDLLERAGYKPSGDISTFLAKMNTMGYVVTGRGELRASENLFG